MQGPLPPLAGTRLWITCYTDASFRPKGAGWGVWLRAADGRVVRRGVCPPYVTSSLEAELAAIFAGIFLACRTWGDRVRGVMIRTDCLLAIHLLQAQKIRRRLQRNHPSLMRLRGKILALVEERAIELDLRWVKGHQQTNTVQAYLNRTCDRLAGTAHTERALPDRQHAAGAMRAGGAESTGGEAGRPGQDRGAGREPPRKPSGSEKRRQRRARSRERTELARKADHASLDSPRELD